MATTELIFLPFLTSSPLRCTSSLLLHVWYLDINGHRSIQKESLCALPVLVACFLCVLMLQKCSHHFQVSRWDVFRSSKAMNGPIGPIGLNVSISSRIKFCEHVKNFPIQKDLLFIFQQLIADTHTHTHTFSRKIKAWANHLYGNLLKICFVSPFLSHHDMLCDCFAPWW